MNHCDEIDNYTQLARIIALSYSSIPGIDVDDVIAEANKSLIKARDSYSANRGSFESYARTVIRNRLNNLYRKQIRISGHEHSFDRLVKSSMESCDPTSLLEDSSADIRKEVRLNETKTILEGLLNELSPRERMVLEKINKGYSLREVGESLEISKQAVHKIAQHALDRLRSRLKEDGFQGLDSSGFLKSYSNSEISPG